jgi:GST-like protein
VIDVHFVPSSNGHKVTILLEELGLPYRLLAYDLLKGDQLTPAYRRINPNGRMPAIVDDDPIGGGEPLAVFESGAILLYLSEKAGGAFMPVDPRRRTCAQQWLMWQMAGLGPMLGQAHHFIRYAPGGQDYGVSRYLNEARRLLAVLENRLAEADFLAEEYSVADIAAWPWVRGVQGLDITLDRYPNIARWFTAVGQRSAVLRGTAVKTPAGLTNKRPALTAEAWSNLFGENMLKSAGA